MQGRWIFEEIPQVEEGDNSIKREQKAKLAWIMPSVEECLKGMRAS